MAVRKTRLATGVLGRNDYVPIYSIFPTLITQRSYSGGGGGQALAGVYAPTYLGANPGAFHSGSPGAVGSVPFSSAGRTNVWRVGDTTRFDVGYNDTFITLRSFVDDSIGVYGQQDALYMLTVASRNGKLQEVALPSETIYAFRCGDGELAITLLGSIMRYTWSGSAYELAESSSSSYGVIASDLSGAYTLSGDASTVSVTLDLLSGGTANFSMATPASITSPFSGEIVEVDVLLSAGRVGEWDLLYIETDEDERGLAGVRVTSSGFELAPAVKLTPAWWADIPGNYAYREWIPKQRQDRYTDVPQRGVFYGMLQGVYATAVVDAGGVDFETVPVSELPMLSMVVDLGDGYRMAVAGNSVIVLDENGEVVAMLDEYMPDIGSTSVPVSAGGWIAGPFYFDGVTISRY